MRRSWLTALLLLPLLSTASPSCPPDFSAFLTEFEKDLAFQLSRTKDPITYWHVNHDDPEMKMQKRVVAKAKRKEYEPYPTREYQEKLRLQRKLESTSPNMCTVSLGVQDSDIYAVDFKFIMSKTKWLLVEVRDNSL
jgi:hypothetical protein